MNDSTTQIMGSGDVAVYESDLLTLVELPTGEPVQGGTVTEAEGSTEQFPDIYFRIANTEPEGTLEVANVYYWFNSISGFQDDPEDTPGVGNVLTITVPKNSVGAVYFKATLYPSTVLQMVFLEEPPATEQYVYYKALANVSREDGSVSFQQRHFGLLTIPSQMLVSPFL